MRPATLAATMLLSLVALAHLARLVFGVEAVVGGWSVPMWVSAVGVVVAGGIAAWLARESRRG